MQRLQIPKTVLIRYNEIKDKKGGLEAEVPDRLFFKKRGKDNKRE